MSRDILHRLSRQMWIRHRVSIRSGTLHELCGGWACLTRREDGGRGRWRRCVCVKGRLTGDGTVIALATRIRREDPTLMLAWEMVGHVAQFLAIGCSLLTRGFDWLGFPQLVISRCGKGEALQSIFLSASRLMVGISERSGFYSSSLWTRSIMVVMIDCSK